MDALVEKVMQLNRQEVIEAVLALQDALAIDEVDSQVSALPDNWRSQPFGHIQDIEQLGRLALLSAAADSARRDLTQSVVQNVGRKAFVFGGAEIVAVGAIALIALQIIKSGGKTAESVSFEIREENGGRVVKVTSDVKYGIGPEVAKLLTSYWKG